ncbi:MAG: HAD-IA family hydrolase [Planctomycetota bacterium]|nr:HAD-IA family hydrolase [Planctomycetota bacterium]
MTTHAPLQAAVFDLDGLMFNTEELYHEVGGQMLQRRGKQLTDDLLAKMMGRQSHEALQIMIDWHDLDATASQLEAETDVIFGEILETRLQPMPGLETLLAFLEEQDVPKAIATSSRRPFAVTMLDKYDMQDRFQFLLTAEDIELGKPNPQIYLRAAERLQLTTSQMMVLEDSGNGCKAAVDSGSYAVAVLANHNRDQVFPGARLVADGLGDPRIQAAFTRV